MRAREPQNVGLLERELVEAFDAADSLCAFNGVRFDIPFLHAALRLSQETTAAWLLKTTDKQNTHSHSVECSSLDVVVSQWETCPVCRMDKWDFDDD